MRDEESKLERRVAVLTEKIGAIEGLPSENKQAISEWKSFLEAKGTAKNTIIKHLYCMERFLAYMPDKTAFSKITREEVQTAVARIEGTDYAQETKHNIKVVVKAFFKHRLGEDEYYPKQVSWIKTTFNKSKKKLPEDMLTEGEVLRMVKAATSPRDKAMISFLYDSGVRVGELLGMKIKDIDLDSEPAHVTVNGKTGMRRIPILFSAPYLASYVEMLGGKKLGDYLWTAVGSWSNMNRRLDEPGARKVLREAAKKAGIGKRIYPHLFRHSRATYYANRLTEQQLKALFGWTGDSKMVSTYVHMSGRDIDDAVLQAYGKQPKAAAAPKLTEKICPRCRYANGMDFLHCRRCGAPLDAGQVDKEDVLRRAVAEHLEDPKFFDELMRAYLKRQQNGKR